MHGRMLQNKQASEVYRPPQCAGWVRLCPSAIRPIYWPASRPAGRRQGEHRHRLLCGHAEVSQRPLATRPPDSSKHTMRGGSHRGQQAVSDWRPRCNHTPSERVSGFPERPT